MGMAVATMVLGGKTFEREVAGVLFDSIGEALVSTKSIVPGSKKRLIKTHWHAAQEDTQTAVWGGRWQCQHGEPVAAFATVVEISPSRSVCS